MCVVKAKCNYGTTRAGGEREREGRREGGREGKGTPVRDGAPLVRG